MPINPNERHSYPKDPELEAKITLWGDEAMHDEEHVALVAKTLLTELSDPDSITNSLLLSGTITLEFAARAASLMVSIEKTNRNYGGAPAVAAAVVRILPPDLTDDL